MTHKDKKNLTEEKAPEGKKYLHDGTLVDISAPTRNGPLGRELLSDEEIAVRQLEGEAWLEEKERYEREEKYRDDRREQYDPIGDQLDVIWKELNARRNAGENLVQDASDMLDKILAVKSKYPKPD